MFVGGFGQGPLGPLGKGGDKES